MHKPKARFKLITTSIAAILLQFLVPQLANIAQASTPGFPELIVREDRMKALTNTGFTVCAETPASGVGSEAFVRVQIPKQTATSGSPTPFTFDTTGSHWSVNTSNLPANPNPGSGGTTLGWPGITTTGITFGTALGNFGPSVTFASGALSASQFYCFNAEPVSTGTPILTNSSVYDPSLTGEKSMVGEVTTFDISGSTAIDQTEYAWDVVNNDQVVVTAVVPPIFTMDINNVGSGHVGDPTDVGSATPYTGVDTFVSDLSISNATATTGVDVDITTNAPNGWETWVKDTYSGMRSVLAGGSVLPTVNAGTPASTTVTPGFQQYGAYGFIPSGGSPGGSCAPTIDALYVAGTITSGISQTIGTLLSTQFLRFADCGAGLPPNTAQYTRFQMNEVANIDAHVPAAPDYTDTITMVGAGNF